MSDSHQQGDPLRQRLLFGYTSDSLPKKMKKYPPPRRGKSSESSYKQLELSFHEK